MATKEQAKQLSLSNNEFVIYKQNVKTQILLQEFAKIEEPYVMQSNANQEKQELWCIFSNEELENNIDSILNDYKARKELIDSIISKTMKNNISGIIINFSEFSNYNNLIKFINEFMPRLREIGITTGIKINKGMKEEDFLKIVDYIVK